MPSPTLWIVAGPNGAGKTTSTQREPISALLAGVRFLNPDDLSREKLLRQGFSGFADAPDEIRLRAFLESADEVFDELTLAVAAGESVGVETVLSTDKYRTVIESVRKAGGFVGLIYVALESPALACQRVAARVRRGGHDVPLIKSRLAGNGRSTIWRVLLRRHQHSGSSTIPIPITLNRHTWSREENSADWSSSQKRYFLDYDPYCSQ